MRSRVTLNEPSKAMQIIDDKFSSVIDAFMDSPKFRGYADSTRDIWSRELRFVARHLGMYSRFDIRPAVIQVLVDKLSGKPGKQAALYASLKQLEKWAVVRDLLPRQIVLGVEVEESDNGHVPWNDDQVALAEQNAKVEYARAVLLAANTGQRGSDLIRMGWSDIETYDGRQGIKVTQKKTGKEIWVPITAALSAAMQTWERIPGPFLRRPSGLLWTRHKLTNGWAYERDHNPMLKSLGAEAVEGKQTGDKGLVLHGLRGTACVRLVRAGANTRQIADMVGMSEAMVAHYTRLSSQKENASAAVYHLERTLWEQKNDMADKRRG